MIDPTVEAAMRRRTAKGVGRTLSALERFAPDLAKKGHPARRAILGELYDILEINLQLVDTVSREDIEVNDLWIMRLDDTTRRRHPDG